MFPSLAQKCKKLRFYTLLTRSEIIFRVENFLTMFSKKSNIAKDDSAVSKPIVKNVAVKKAKEEISSVRIAWASGILKKPVVTEKALLAQGINKKAQFIVALQANKIQIAQAVRAVYGVGVTQVRVIKVKGKIKKLKGRTGKRSDYKKAIVTLAQGETIDVHHGV